MGGWWGAGTSPLVSTPRPPAATSADADGAPGARGGRLVGSADHTAASDAEAAAPPGGDASGDSTISPPCCTPLPPTKMEAACLREVTALSKIRHPNLLLYMGACVAPPAPLCIISEYYPHGTLHELLHEPHRRSSAHVDGDSGGAAAAAVGGDARVTPPPPALLPGLALPLSASAKRALALDVARGLHYLHAHGMMHGDLKARNVLVRDDGRLIIADFGLSQLVQSGTAGVAASCTASVVGTPSTMAPEVIDGGTYTKAADAYSFGVILWEIYTGRPPWRGLRPIQIMFGVSAGKRLTVGADDGVPASIVDLLDACWRDEPAERPTMQELLVALTKAPQ